MTQTPILLATTNPDKQRALRTLLDSLPLSPATPEQIGLGSAPDEEGKTHLEVACQKATHWSKAGSTLAIASDGGLVLPALGTGWESRYTHRFAGEPDDGLTRVYRLLELMRPYRGEERQASWIEALAIAYQGRVLVSWQLNGAVGVIANDPPEALPETSGFWVFSVWEFPELGKRYNQLSPAELASLDDHWTRLRGLVQRYFRGYFVTPVA